MKSNLIGLHIERVGCVSEQQMNDYSDLITHYYDVIAKRCIKCNYSEQRGMSYLRKLDEWEACFFEYLEMGA